MTDFDLTRFSRVGYAPLSRGLSIGAGVALMGLSIVGAIAIVSGLISSREASVQWGAVVALLFVAVVPFVGAWRIQRPGATRLEVDSLGVTFHYSRRLVQRWTWSELARPVKIIDGSSAREFPQEFNYYTHNPMIRDTVLSREAFLAIIESAQRAGLNIARRSERTLYGPATAIMIGPAR